jgi:outer membrane protein TolC
MIQKNMKTLLILISLICLLDETNGQSLDKLTIEESYRLATENYPLTKQRELISRSEEYSLSNAAKGILPVITINGQDSYQSDVTNIPIEVPEVIEELSKHQYKIYGELSANLYDGGVIRNQKESYRANAKIDEQKLEVELYKLKDRINQLFFGILLLDAQLVQNELLKSDIQRGIERINASIANGIALKSSADVLHAEYLKADQKTIELHASRHAYIEMLGLMIGETLNDSTRLEKPASLTLSSAINRPELRLYDYQRDAIDVQTRMLATRNRPKLSLFFQGGYGRPALDMLDNQPEAYYITGIRLNWTISGFYTYKKEKALLSINQMNLDLQKQTFIHNTNLSLNNHRGEVSKLHNVMATDDQIIALREKIKNTAAAQLENGVINSNDYLREVTAEDLARQNKILHEIQLLLAQYNLQTTTGI